MTTDQHDTAPAPDHEGEAATAFAERVFGDALGAFELLSIYLGDRLGWYRALAEAGPLDAPTLAARTGTQERYAREWLEQQAVYGILTVDDADAEASARRFALPPAHADALVNPDSLDYVAPLGRFIAAAGAQLGPLLEAYRSGGGVSWAQLGDEARWAQGDINRPWFLHRLGEALAGVAVAARRALAARRAGSPTSAWGTAGRRSPSRRRTRRRGSRASTSTQSRSSRHAGMPTRRRRRPCAVPPRRGRGRCRRRPSFDAAFVFEALHDMPFPVEVLTAIRRAVKPDGEVVIMDEAVAEAFAPDGDEVERVMYGYSILMCLPDGLSTPGSVGTGTVMRPSTLDRYAREAGFSGTEILPIEGFAAFRFTRLLH